MSGEQLHPVNPPIGTTEFINPRQETRLILKEKVRSVTGDAFDIKIDPGNGQPPQPIFKVDPSWITTKKSFYDMNGKHLFDVKKEWMHFIHRTFKAVDPQGTKFFQVKSGFACEFKRCIVFFCTMMHEPSSPDNHCIATYPTYIHLSDQASH